MKVLNLYAGIGGNRTLWPQECEVTAVEIIPKIAGIYQEFFPKDRIIVADAHQYLLGHYKEFDFIWSSPPCQSHSGTNNFLNPQGIIRYPDMKLYEEVLFLRHFCKCKWVVENVKSYYAPFIVPQQVGRHYFWSNFVIADYKTDIEIGTMNRSADKRKQDKATKQQILRNCVNPKLGLHVLCCAFKYKQTELGL